MRITSFDYIKLLLFFLSISLSASAQIKTPADFGFRHLQTLYLGDTVNILVKSKKGEENNPKPLLLFCQGSLPQSLIKYDREGAYGVFPFDPEIFTADFHIAIISKPGVPLIADAATLGDNFTHHDVSRKFSEKYVTNNHLDFYVSRNKKALKFLLKQPWVSDKKLILAGHSEGGTIAVKLAAEYKKTTHLIYSGGNPLGRILSIIGQHRSLETDSATTTEEIFKSWEETVANKNKLAFAAGDPPKTTYSFSAPAIPYFRKLKTPVLVSYGTKDQGAPFNDFLRVEMVRQQKKNITFKAYLGMEHNYFPLEPDGSPNQEIYNWDIVAKDWKNWLETL